MGILIEDYDISPLVPISTNELQNLRTGLINLMKYAEGHDKEFVIEFSGNFESEAWDHAERIMRCSVCPDDVFECTDVNYHVYETVWCPADIGSIISKFETSLYKLNDETSKYRPFTEFKIVAVAYGKHQIYYRQPRFLDL